MTIQQGGAAHSQTVVRQAVPVPTAKPQPGIRPPGMIQTVVRTSVPGVTTTVGQPQVLPAAAVPAPAAQAVASAAANPSKFKH